MIKIRQYVISAGLISMITAMAMTSSNSAKADDDDGPQPGCHPVHGTIATDITTVGCTSPVDLCTVGSTAGSDLLRGTTSYTTRALGPTAADPTDGISVSYTGKLTLHTRHGDLFVTDLGLLDYSDLSFTEMSRTVSGTGKFANVTGHIFFFGNVAPVGFRGQIGGELCLPPRPDRD